MVSGINNIENIEQSLLQPNFSKWQDSKTYEPEPLNSFADEDEAIISAQANLQYELEKFNSGEGDVVDLLLQGVESKFIVEANVNVINTKKDMMDTILGMGE